MIIFTPADLPKIEPDNWNIFWKIWNENNKPVVKTRFSTKYSHHDVGNNTVWTGLDIYKGPYDDPMIWDAPYYDISKELPKLYEFLSTFDELCIRARLVQSQCSLLPHTDTDIDMWQLRAYFHYTDIKEQWYFTKPLKGHGKKNYITIPPETNWFIYNDKYAWHGVDFNKNHKKILLQIFSHNNYLNLKEQSIKKYKHYTITSREL